MRIRSMNKMNKNKAEILKNYIVARYGRHNLGNLKALAVIPEFRKRAQVGFNMVTKHGVILRRGKNGKPSSLSQGNLLFEYNDDIFGSITAGIQRRIRAAYPEYAAFDQTPVIHMGDGINIGNTMSLFDK